MFKRILSILIFLIVLALAFHRSVILDITNDEAYSFKLVHQLHDHFETARNLMIGTANTHWFNSFFLCIEDGLIGHAPWMLRLHSVLALALLIYALYKLFEKEKAALMLIPFLLIIGNHYLFDFFSLARGYALELAFQMMAFLSIFKKQKPSRVYFWLILSCLANYTNMYLLMAYLIVETIQTFKHSGELIFLKLAFFKSRWTLFPFVLWAIPNILFIKYVTNDLEEGRRNNFITDTLGVFLERSYGGMNTTFYFTLAGILLLVTSCWFFYMRKRISSAWETLFFLFIVFIVLIHFFFFFLNTPYPYGRTALSFWLLFLLLLSFMLIEWLKKLKPVLQSIILTMLLGAPIVFMLNWNIKTTVEWPKQQGMSEWVNDLRHVNKKNIKELKVAMSVDHFGVYDNYYHYLHPENLPSHILIYDRKGYDHIPDTICRQFQHQDELMMFGQYESFLDSFIPNSNRKFMKRYPEMETDWWRNNR